jgi:exonuclease SbcC
MRILHVRFENINSLAGKWEVDFTNKEFVENGLFSIVGPTGSGKSSILDAITLGLYGQTPRQKNVRSNNEIMTYGTANCSAIVTFEVNGVIYRSYFEQKRARGKIDGQLQGQKLSLYKIKEDETEESLTDKNTETTKKIEELIGLDYEQFTKAVMLPQGAFSRFLTSDNDDRAKILEQLSGSGKYREYSKKVEK